MKTPRELALQTDPAEIRARRAIKLCLPLLLLVFLFEYARAGKLLPALAQAAPAPRAPAPVWQLTYLKAHDAAAIDSLARAVTANWFVMDARAVADGHLQSYHLLRGSAADTSWDLLEVTVFRDSLQQAHADSVYRTTYRPSHRVVLVGGKELNGWGRIVRSDVMRKLTGTP